MKRIFIAATAALMAVGAAAPLAAASINAKQVDQRRLIDAGERSGKLTAREVRTLRAEQDAIEREKDRLKADGTYSKRDKRIIHARQDAAERHIKGSKSNGRRAPSQKILGAKVF